VTTFSDVIERTRRRLMTSMREQVNLLAATIDNDDTALSFAHSTRFTEGARLSIELEDMRVTSGSGTTTANVIRGMDGSTAVAHTAPVIVRVNPTWTNFEIGQAVNDELADLSSPMNGLFRVRSVDFTYNPSKQGYELSGLQDFLDVWRVRYNEPGPEDVWQPVPPAYWRVDQAADTTDFPSGVQLVLKAGGHPGQTVRVSYRATFDPLVALADDVLAVAGLHNEAHDILSLGAAIRLLSGEEAHRAYTTAQANPRRADEVPPRTAVSALQPLVAQREERVRAEANRLAARSPGGRSGLYWRKASPARPAHTRARTGRFGSLSRPTGSTAQPRSR